MVTTRARSGATKKPEDTDVQLQKTFGNQSLLAWASGSTKNKSEKPGPVRIPQTSAAILHLPIDILSLIFSKLHPLDLLRLGRTCYDLKVFFHSEASKSTWRASRKALGFVVTAEDVRFVAAAKEGSFYLPDPPAHLSEPAYASFLFEPVCSYCYSLAYQIELSIVGTRACQICHTKDLVSLKALQVEWKEDADPRLYDILPRLKNRLSNKKPKPSDKIYHKPTCQLLFDQCMQYELEVNFDSRKVRTFFAKGEQEVKEREAFVESYAEYKTARSYQDLILYERWDRERAERIARNKAFIVMKLEQEDIEIFVTDIEDSRRVSSLISGLEEDLSESKFAEIKTEVLNSLQPVQEQRRCLTEFWDPENARIRHLLDECRNMLSPTSALAECIRLPEFVGLPTCKALANMPAFIHGEEEQRLAIWNQSVDGVQQDIATWVSAQEQYILGLLEEEKAIDSEDPGQHDLYDLDLDLDMLRMPFIRLECHECELFLTLAEFLVHDCPEALPHLGLTNTRRRLAETGISTAEEYEAPLSLKILQPDNVGLDWHATIVGKAVYEAVVAAGGEPPRTARHLRNKKGTITCAACPNDSAEYLGTTIRLCLMAHSRPPICWAKAHKSFTYELPEGGLEADVNDDAETHLMFPWADPLGGYDSDEISESYLDYMHGGMMADMNADMMMDTMMAGYPSDDDDW